MDSKQILLVSAITILSFILGYSCCYEIEHKKQSQQQAKPNNKVTYKLKKDSEGSLRIPDVKNRVKPETLQDFEQLSKRFYSNLADCKPLNVKTENGYEMYIIEGYKDNKCHFKHRQVGFVDTICALPVDITKRYADEGLEEIRQLEELKSKNKTGFVQGSPFINEINNNKNYCRYEKYEHKRK